MNEVLEVKFDGWTTTPRLPFVLSGNALCMTVPSYSSLLGLIGCCLGRLVSHTEVEFGFHYQYDTTGNDLETRQRLEFDGRTIKPHPKGSDAYRREFHVVSSTDSTGDLQPCLTLWLNRTDWIDYFRYPLGTPALGRSQDLLRVRFDSVKIISVEPVSTAKVGGCALPFKSGMQVAGQLVQLADAYEENERIGAGRNPINPRVFINLAHDTNQEVTMTNLFKTSEGQSFYLHNWQ
ncbi:hypothetical protein [Spirosoma utsteinense]|uniref:CRISPR-associated protein Cas5t n=1 Tax=Spirosoma utsteinense TaxID=2585773 RepID=A0ABR6WGV2_9BACT|nr:hypothetical protein [Spirosoma utsteinense]MBC3788610.1 CRISPR-associated protein Cas5t [Spirosoma utsteinense]MBC3795312.1 CRISPR-associated protein Cas5t [Spirosoma utsteinense]